MERVAFLVEATNERIGCLLNPETLVLRRVAGVRPQRSATGQMTGKGLTDDPLLFTGGGRTELDLDLLFDVTLAGSSITTEDVRDLTGPLWALAENANRQEGYGQPPLVRFIWGKSWNMLGVIVAVAERLAYFTPEGMPRRSWLRLRMVRANEPPSEPPPGRAVRPTDLAVEAEAVPEESLSVEQIIGGAPTAEPGRRPELPAALQADGLTATTASEIVAAALAETQARAALSAALGAVGGAAATILAALGETEEPLPEEEQAAAEAVESETQSILSILESAASAVETGVVGAVTTAATTVASAIGRVEAAAATMTSEAGSFIAVKVEAAVETMAPAVATMRETAATVARAVKRKSAAVIAAAVEGWRGAIETVDRGLDTVAAVTSDAGREALALIGSATKTVGNVLDQVKATGEAVVGAGAAVVGEQIPAALERLAAGAEALWAAGETAAVRAVEGAAKVLAIGLRNVTAAAEAINAVLITPAIEVVNSAVGTLRTALEKLGAETTAPDQVGAIAKTASDAAARIDAALAVIAPRLDAETVEPSTEASATLRTLVAQLSDLDPASRAEAMDRIAQALETLTDTVAQAPARETSAVAEMVKTAMGTGAAAREAREAAGAPRIGSGQRLDQVAYRHYGDPALWRLLAAFNQVAHPLRLPAGQLLRVPPLAALTWRER